MTGDTMTSNAVTRNSIGRRAAALALFALAVGCHAPMDDAARGAAPSTYWGRRADDLARSFECTLCFGPGLGARVTATRWLQAGALAIGPAERASLVMPLPERSVGLRAGAWRCESLRTLEYGCSPWYASDATLFGVEGEPLWRGDLAATRETQFSAQLHLAFIGASLGFDPAAFLRLLAGLVGFESTKTEEAVPPN